MSIQSFFEKFQPSRDEAQLHIKGKKLQAAKMFQEIQMRRKEAREQDEDELYQAVKHFAPLNAHNAKELYSELTALSRKEQSSQELNFQERVSRMSEQLKGFLPEDLRALSFDKVVGLILTNERVTRDDSLTDFRNLLSEIQRNELLKVS